MPRAKKSQPVQAAPSQEYGQRVAQEEAQRALPLPAQQAPPPAASVVPMTAPTQRPNEPITAGLPTGPGPGPEAIGLPATSDLRAVVGQAWKDTRDPAILDLLMMIEEQGL